MTASSNRDILDILNIANLKPDKLIGGDDVVNAKPDPEMIFKAFDYLKVKDSEILYVGDSVYDQEAAKSLHNQWNIMDFLAEALL